MRTGGPDATTTFSGQGGDRAAQTEQVNPQFIDSEGRLRRRLHHASADLLLDVLGIGSRLDDLGRTRHESESLCVEEHELLFDSDGVFSRGAESIAAPSTRA